jgi:hypothetical protein
MREYRMYFWSRSDKNDIHNHYRRQERANSKERITRCMKKIHPIDFSPLKDMKPSEMRSDLEFLLWHYRIVDAFWFLFVADELDLQTAERLNERVWGKVAGMAARDLLKRFHIKEKGLCRFVEAQTLFPWAIIIGYEID